MTVGGAAENTGAKANNSTPRPVDAQQKLDNILLRLDGLGILDLASGFLEDQKQVDMILKVALSEESMALLAKLDSVLGFMSEIDYVGLRRLVKTIKNTQNMGGLHKLVELVGLLERRGLLDPLLGILEDEATFKRLAAALSDERLLTVVSRSDLVLEVLSRIDYNGVIRFLEALEKVPALSVTLLRITELLVELDRRGLVEPVIGLLQDEKVFGQIVNLIAGDKFLGLVDHLDRIFGLLLNLTNVDEQLLGLITTMQTTTFKRFLAAFGSMGKEEPRTVKGTFALMRQLGDPDVAVGLGVVFQFLKKLGQEYGGNQMAQ
jgi:uncharacterized protein YjgD (DUF1641 family)